MDDDFVKIVKLLGQFDWGGRMDRVFEFDLVSL